MATHVTLRLSNPAWHPTFTDLPWDQPLADWVHQRIVDAPTGIHRHVVRFVDYDGQIYVLKELGRRLALKEYRLLRELNDRGLPVVLMVGIVERPGLDPIVITRFLNHALPFRYVLARSEDPDRPFEVVRAIAALLAQLHVSGFSWGDCSLSNSMVRRDADRLSAYALDTETGELHPRLTSGQRQADLDIAHENLAGGFADLAAGGALSGSVDPFELADRFVLEYQQVWSDLYSDRVVADGAVALDDLHLMGFDVLEARIDLAGDGRANFSPLSIGEGHHRRQFHDLTGLVAREHQASHLLREIRRSHGNGDLEQAAHAWLADTYEPILAAIPDEHRRKLEAAQLVIEVLEHWRRHPGGQDMSAADAARDFVESELGGRPDERVVVDG
jgi:hypothetical protein